MDVGGGREGLWRAVVFRHRRANVAKRRRRTRNPIMTKTSKRFDAFGIVMVPFPYADRLVEKRRPALVISNRRLTPYALIWVAMITSADNAPWSCDVTIANLSRAGLPAPSVVRTAKIACIEPARIERRAGRLEGDREDRGAKVKGVFGKRVRPGPSPTPPTPRTPRWTRVRRACPS
jgi:mRNA interferase MazF